MVQFFSIILVSSLIFVSSAKSQTCQPNVLEHIVLEDSDDYLTASLVLENEPTLFSSAVSSEEPFFQFRNYILSRTQVDPYERLSKQRDLHVKFMGEKYRRYFDLAISKEVGSILEISCVDSFIYNFHLKVTNTIFNEYLAFVFKKQDKIKILHFSNKKEASARLVVDVLGEINNGWDLLYQIHNHPFFFNNESGDIAGTTIPSPGDLMTYKKQEALFSLTEARVTNGFNTILLNKLDWEKLSAADPSVFPTAPLAK